MCTPTTYWRRLSARLVGAPSTQAVISPGSPLLEVPAEVGRDLEGDLDLVRFQPQFHLVRGLARRVADEVPRALEGREVGAALGRAVEVEVGEADVLDVGGDAEAEGEHHEGRADEREEEADRVALDLLGLAAAVGEHPSQAEPGPGIVVVRGGRRGGGRREGRGVGVGSVLALRFRRLAGRRRRCNR